MSEIGTIIGCSGGLTSELVVDESSDTDIIGP